MSNKTDFQAKNTRLNANNTDLSSILETINNLPEAGSGGGSGKLLTGGQIWWAKISGNPASMFVGNLEEGKNYEIVYVDFLEFLMNGAEETILASFTATTGSFSGTESIGYQDETVQVVDYTPLATSMGVNFKSILVTFYQEIDGIDFNSFATFGLYFIREV